MDAVDTKSGSNGDFVINYMVLWAKNGALANDTNCNGVYVDA